MALEPNPDPLERAVRALQHETPPGWIELSETIMSRVRSMVTHAVPILSHAPGGGTLRDPDNSRTFVSARVVKAALRRLMQRPTHAASTIGLTVNDGRLEHVTVELVCAYGQVLPMLGDRVRVEIAAELTALLGGDPQFDPVTNISVEVVDVVAGDPRKN